MSDAFTDGTLDKHIGTELRGSAEDLRKAAGDLMAGRRNAFGAKYLSDLADSLVSMATRVDALVAAPSAPSSQTTADATTPTDELIGAVERWLAGSGPALLEHEKAVLRDISVILNDVRRGGVPRDTPDVTDDDVWAFLTAMNGGKTLGSTTRFHETKASLQHVANRIASRASPGEAATPDARDEPWQAFAKDLFSYVVKALGFTGHRNGCTERFTRATTCPCGYQQMRVDYDALFDRIQRLQFPESVTPPAGRGSASEAK